ncbi:Sec-independent protein translocase protein TatB [Sneathiella sp.]|uniref:Sec-independent protein translocase protein TatB n=1 Tax=Sneathiella sp. TaxID=1964365 RepID=UPI00356515D3
MFDIGWSEMMFVVIIAVLVIGPKDLPRAISTVGKYVRKARAMARDFQSGLNDLARETELDDIKKDLQKNTDFNVKKQVEDAVDPTGSFSNMFNDIKPEIRDPRISSNNYSEPEGKTAGDTAGDTTKKTAEALPEPNADAPAPASPENKIGGVKTAEIDRKPETKAS